MANEDQSVEIVVDGKVVGGVVVNKAETSMVITLPIVKQRLSKKEKTFLIATTHGNRPTGVTVNGKSVTLGVNAFITK